MPEDVVRTANAVYTPSSVFEQPYQLGAFHVCIIHTMRKRQGEETNNNGSDHSPGAAGGGDCWGAMEVMGRLWISGRLVVTDPSIVSSGLLGRCRLLPAKRR